MTPKVQRIGIILIAIIMIVGTLGSFAVMVIANNNALEEQEQLAQEAQKQAEEAQKQADELSAKYSPTLKKYEDRAKSFDADKVGDKVAKTDLQKGDGEVVAEDSEYRVYYIGWNPEGTVFDSSFDPSGDKLNAPLTHLGGGLWEFPGGQTGNVIEGWTQGIPGMRVGGVREITIPADLAYGDQDRGADIPPNTPLKFIIMAIPAADE